MKTQVETQRRENLFVVLSICDSRRNKHFNSFSWLFIRQFLVTRKITKCILCYVALVVPFLGMPKQVEAHDHDTRGLTKVLWFKAEHWTDVIRIIRNYTIEWDNLLTVKKSSIDLRGSSVKPDRSVSAFLSQVNASGLFSNQLIDFVRVMHTHYGCNDLSRTWMKT